MTTPAEPVDNTSRPRPHAGAEGDDGVEVVDSVEHHRYEIHVAGRLAGFAAYRRGSDRRTFTHTEIDPAYEGRGLGSQLARAALDSTRSLGLLVVPLCPFIAGYIDRHPEFQDLLAPAPGQPPRRGAP